MPNRPNEARYLFEAMCAVENVKQSWRGCFYSKCKAQKTCTGGPRGTCGLTRGFTACSERGKRMLGAKARQVEWVKRQDTKPQPSIAEIMLRVEEVKIERHIQLEEDERLFGPPDFRE